MDPNSSEALGLTAFVAMDHLLRVLDARLPGLKAEVIASALNECETSVGQNFPAIITNLKRL